MVEVEEQDALGLQQLSLKLISIHIVTKYGKLHYSTLIRVVESCTMVLIQHGKPKLLHSRRDWLAPVLNLTTNANCA